MKAVHTVADIDRRSGGPSYTVTSLCDHLLEQGIDAEIHTLDTGREHVNPKSKHAKYPIMGPGRLGLSPALKSGLISTLTKQDVLHSHGLWMMPNVYPKTIKKQVGCPMVISTRGMLSQWALEQSSSKKRVLSWLGQRSTLEAADCLHATAESEYEDIRRYGLKNPVAIIPNGIDLSPESIVDDLIARSRSSHNSHKKLLFLSRIHPKKGLDLLLDTWKKIEQCYPKWELVICGPGEEPYLSHIKSRARSMGDRVKYAEASYGEEKTQMFASADLFVLPTKSENFGIVVAEALAHKTPCIVTDGAPWEGLEGNGCGWWIENNEASLTRTLRQAMDLEDKERDVLGQKGFDWMRRDFSWEHVAHQMTSVYSWLHGSKLPGCVRVN